jgi:ribosome-associated protein
VVAGETARAGVPPPREDSPQAADERLVSQVKRAVAALLDKKAEKLVVLHLGGLTAVSDYFVLASGTSDRQAQALADAVETAMKAEGRRPQSVEGYRTGTWILLDYGDAVFHIFHDEARRFYGLERLWGDAPDATARFS